ncbi:RIB43A-like with coiled-coils protein 2 [Lethenteron reissneri]|uniref:RIB43A-like with coiled-coils protein 2 n=1 Tax=Lethenteron reissneri TaxID=7753 RepID=UPI002AB668FD|nr:RIB43A-like with coiled-coils protein 2 [Lethenteron reissneri]
MFQLEQREAAAIARRRQLELERRSRIFNPKVRTIGVDLDGLNEQVEQRRFREQQEKTREEAFADAAIRHDRIAILLDERQREESRALDRSLAQYWARCQSASDRSQPPADVVADEGAVSGLRSFAGEDLEGGERRGLQKEQQRRWLLEQQEEKRRAQDERRNRDELYDAMRLEMDRRAMQLSLAEESCRRVILTATKDFNRAQAEEQEAKRRQEHEREEAASQAEIAALLEGGLLTEDPSQASSALSPLRVVPDRWKGMSGEQLHEIRLAQERQREEKKRLEEEKRRRDEEWERQSLQAARIGTLLEQEQQRSAKEQRRALDSTNMQLASEQNMHREFLEKEVYKNTPTEQFFAQFNTSSR